MFFIYYFAKFKKTFPLNCYGFFGHLQRSFSVSDIVKVVLVVSYYKSMVMIILQFGAVKSVNSRSI